MSGENTAKRPMADGMAETNVRWRMFGGLLSPRKLGTLLRVLRNGAGEAGGSREHLDAAMQWLVRAQDISATGGVSYGYGLLDGWRAPYPETTGYCIPTFLRYAGVSGDRSFFERAQAMAEWELRVQRPDGGFAGGPVRPNPDRLGVAFDTGQVLQGLVAIYRETSDERFRRAAERAGEWLVAHQHEDGAWRDCLPPGHTLPRAYNVRSCWSLLQLHEVSPQSKFRDAAARHVEWTLARQQVNGWFRDNSFVPDAPALTHTIGYVLEGLIECWQYLKDDRILDATVRGGEAVRDELERRGWLPATFDANWKSSDRYSCVTGCAQIAISWFRLFEATGRREFLDSAIASNRWLKSRQLRALPDENLKGGIPGSYPVYGAYERLHLPNWAAKFFADAMMDECALASGASREKNA